MYKLKGRIDSNNAAEFEADIMKAASPDLVLDADDLEYISSAGLRVLMKLRKAAGKPLAIVNVSPEVYDIFEVTGFTDLLDVKKRLREVSVEGCELLGEGANGRVYRLTRDEMIKIFRPGLTLEEIEAEREASRRAFLMGIPCAIAFDTVRSGDSYGTIYETLNAATLTERIRENPGRVDELAKYAAELLKELHSIEIPEGEMRDASVKLHSAIDSLTADFTSDELKKMHALYDSIPAMNRFVHSDFHAKNIMEIEPGELMLIDLGDAGSGNPLIDLIHSYMVFNIIGTGMKNTDDNDLTFIGLTYRESREFWKILAETYFGNAETADDINAKIEPYGRLMYFTTAMAHPRLPKQYHPMYAEMVREQVLSKYDEIKGSLVDVCGELI